MLSVGGQNSDQLAQEEAQRLVALIELAREEAIIHNREIAVSFGRDGYRFLLLEGEKWQPISTDELLRPRELPPSLELQLNLEGDPPGIGKADEANTPHLFLLSSGESTPFEVTIKPADEPGGYRLIGQEDDATLIRKLDDVS